MRITIAKFSAIYTGRGDTKLDAATRTIMIKNDGSVQLHCEKGIKPLNYMSKAVFSESVIDGMLVWHFDTPKESLTLTIEDIYSDVDYLLPDEEPGLQRDGTERQLQDILCQNPHFIKEGFTIVEREWQTDAGPVDFLCKDKNEKYVLVEVKRVATTEAVGQVQRYWESAKETYPDCEAMIVALDVRPKASLLSERRGIQTSILDKSIYK